MVTAPSGTELHPPLSDGSLVTANSGQCNACAHELIGHDRISLRYCHATHDGGLNRGCVCPASASGTAQGKPVAFR